MSESIPDSAWEAVGPGVSLDSFARDAIEAAAPHIARAARIDELQRQIARIGDRDTISEHQSNQLRARIAELEAEQ